MYTLSPCEGSTSNCGAEIEDEKEIENFARMFYIHGRKVQGVAELSKALQLIGEYAFFYINFPHTSLVRHPRSVDRQMFYSLLPTVQFDFASA